MVCILTLLRLGSDLASCANCWHTGPNAQLLARTLPSASNWDRPSAGQTGNQDPRHRAPAVGCVPHRRPGARLARLLVVVRSVVARRRVLPDAADHRCRRIAARVRPAKVRSARAVPDRHSLQPRRLVLQQRRAFDLRRRLVPRRAIVSRRHSGWNRGPGSARNTLRVTGDAYCRDAGRVSNRRPTDR